MAKVKSLERLKNQQAKQIRQLEELLNQKTEELYRLDTMARSIQRRYEITREVADYDRALVVELTDVISKLNLRVDKKHEDVEEARRVGHLWRHEAVRMRQHLAAYPVVLRLLQGEVLNPRIFPN